MRYLCGFIPLPFPIHFFPLKPLFLFFSQVNDAYFCNCLRVWRLEIPLTLSTMTNEHSDYRYFLFLTYFPNTKTSNLVFYDEYSSGSFSFFFLSLLCIEQNRSFFKSSLLFPPHLQDGYGKTYSPLTTFYTRVSRHLVSLKII